MKYLLSFIGTGLLLITGGCGGNTSDSSTRKRHLYQPEKQQKHSSLYQLQNHSRLPLQAIPCLTGTCARYSTNTATIIHSSTYIMNLKGGLQRSKFRKHHHRTRNKNRQPAVLDKKQYRSARCVKISACRHGEYR